MHARAGDAPDRERPSPSAARRRGAGGAVRSRDAGGRAHAAHQRPQHRRQDRTAQGGGARGRAGAERHRAAGRRRQPASGVRRRSSPTSATASRSPRACPPSAPTSPCCGGCSTGRTRPPWCCWTRSGAGPIRRKARRWRRQRWWRSPAAATLTLATTHLGALKDLASHTPGRGERVAPVRRGDADADLSVPQRRARPLLRTRHRPAARRGQRTSWRTPRPGCPTPSGTWTRCWPRWRSASARSTPSRRRDRARDRARRARARLRAEAEHQAAREAELERREKAAEREGRRQAKAYLMDARRLVEEALGAARTAADDAAAREARRKVEEGIREQGERLAAQDAESYGGGGAAVPNPASRQATGCGCQAARPARCWSCAPTARP